MIHECFLFFFVYKFKNLDFKFTQMNIAIHVRFLVANKLEGIGRFTFETIQRICKNHPEHTFYLLFDRMYEPEFVFSTNVVPIVVPFPARHPLLWWFWFHIQLPRVLKNIPADIFISTDGFLPPHLSIPTVNVIHDLNFEHNPEHVPPLVRWYYKKFFPLYAHKATRIATVSEFSKQDICTTYSIAPQHVDVLYNGVSSEFEPLTETQKTIVKKTYTRNTDYFIYVGSLHPRKNIERLLAAFELFKKQTQSDVTLVIVGEAMFLSKSIQKAYDTNAYKNDIIFTGRVPNNQLALLTGAAYAMTYVPLFEGFGIPILEAFACNVPVITSRCTSMPEVAGNAALYCDPLHTESIAVAMKKIVQDKELYHKLQEYSNIQKQKYSWDKTAELLWKSISKVVRT